MMPFAQDAVDRAQHARFVVDDEDAGRSHVRCTCDDGTACGKTVMLAICRAALLTFKE